MLIDIITKDLCISPKMNYRRKHFIDLNLVSVFKCHFLLTTIWSEDKVYFMPLGRGDVWPVLLPISL